MLCLGIGLEQDFFQAEGKVLEVMELLKIDMNTGARTGRNSCSTLRGMSSVPTELSLKQLIAF